MTKTNYMMTVDDVAEELGGPSRKATGLSVSSTRSWRMPGI